MNVFKLLLLLASIATAFPAQSGADMNQMNDQERILVILAKAKLNRLTRRHFLFH